MSPHLAPRRAWAAGWTFAAVTLVPLVAGEPATSASTALPRTTLTAKARDLGTLGGTSSSARDVDGPVVVGSSLLADGVTRHAFAYDLRGSTMRDLGTLGGRNSEALAVAGTVVAGTADTADGKRHAFAYDLATSTMHDIGSLVPGGTSEANAVDGGVVVGQSGPTVGQGHAFAYDVATETLRDLGDLGLDQSRAVAVDAGTVVGEAWSTTTWQRQSFAYDLGTSMVRTISAGTPTDFSGSVVVGNAPNPSRSPTPSEPRRHATSRARTCGSPPFRPSTAPQPRAASSASGRPTSSRGTSLPQRPSAATVDLSAAARFRSPTSRTAWSSAVWAAPATTGCDRSPSTCEPPGPG